MDEKEILKEQILKEQFAKSDGNLLFIKGLLKAICIIFSIISIITGIILMIAGASVGNALGLIFILAVPLIIIVVYNISKFTLWIAYDIKCIRNAVNNVEESQELKNF